MIHQEINNADSVIKQCEIVWNHYLSRKLNNNFEPIWTHHPYQIVKNYLDKKELSAENLFLLKEIIKSHTQKDGTEVPVKTGFPKEGTRLMHDCWKAGSFTWIFMGRMFCKEIHQYKDFIVLNRKLPEEIYALTDQTAPPTLFAAYTLKSNYFVGPSTSSEQLINHLDQQEPPQF